MPPKLQLLQVVRDDAQPVRTISFVLNAALDACRAGTLDELIARRPGSAQWLVRTYLRPVIGTAGDALPAMREIPVATGWLLAWGITQLRPDRVPSMAITDRKAWLESTSWRPAIALMCHYGFAPVPEFRDRYYRRAGESAADNLCGVWNIGQSTFYRYLDKGKRLLARLLQEQRLDQRHAASLRAFVEQCAYVALKLEGESQRHEWHRRQIEAASSAEDWLSTIWHLRRIGRVDQACDLIQRHLALLAVEPELDQLLAAFHDDRTSPHDDVKLLCLEAAVWQTRNRSDREHDAYQRALQTAVEAQDRLSIGLVYGHLGKHYEPRDPDRAFSYYQDSVAFLWQVEGEGGHAATAAVHNVYVGTMAKLAWLYTLRNDPRAKAVLDRANAIQERHPADDRSAALLEQTWGEYWRRSSDIQKALEHQHRTLNIYQRLNDQQGIVKAYINLGLTYTDLRHFERAIDYLTQVINLSRTFTIGAEAITSAHLNLGICRFWMGEYDAAIREYGAALQTSEANHLAIHTARAHHNLAEAYFIKFTKTRQRDDELRGDTHAALAAQSYRTADNAGYLDVVMNLKRDILGGMFEGTADRMLPGELAANYGELSELDQHRAALAAPAPPEEHVRAHLAIAKSYLAVSAKEREAALALIDKHGLRDQFAGEFEALRSTFERTLTREQKLSALWKQCAGDLLSDERRAGVITHLLHHGTINKSGYAELCGTGLATASKHLGQLAELGLLTQTGKGPSTRYVLPDPPPNSHRLEVSQKDVPPVGDVSPLPKGEG